MINPSLPTLHAVSLRNSDKVPMSIYTELRDDGETVRLVSPAYIYDVPVRDILALAQAVQALQPIQHVGHWTPTPHPTLTAPEPLE